MRPSKDIFDAYEERSWRSVARRQRALGMEFVAGRREGSYIWDAEGRRRLLDCTTGGGVHALGHRNPEVVAALQGALDRGLDGGMWMMPNEEHLGLQDALAASAPHAALNRSVLTLAASNSNDLALLFAFRVTGRRKVLAYRHGYHGHAGFAALVTGSAGENVIGYYNLPDATGRFFEPYGDLAAVERLIDRDVAAIIVEPMDYETFAPPPPGYLPGLAALAHRHGALLIMDETRTGLMRSGRMWMCQHSGAEPDMLVCGKGLSGGLYPASAVLTTAAIYDRCINQHELAYASSMGGNEISAAVGRKVIEIVRRPDLAANVAALEERFKMRFGELCRRRQDTFFPGTVQGAIATIGLATPAHREAIAPALFRRGILMHSVSAIAPDGAKFFPPLTSAPAAVDEIADALDDIARAWRAGGPGAA